MSPFGAAFAVIFLAELADKSRIAGLLLVSVYRRPLPVFLGMTAGYALLQGLSVWLGSLLPGVLPGAWVRGAAGALFLAFGAACFLLGEEREEEARDWLRRMEAWGPFWVSCAVTAASEAADRTQLATVALTAESGAPRAVFAGAMSALTLLNAATVWLGERIARRVSAKALRRLAGAFFLAFGAAMLAAAF